MAFNQQIDIQSVSSTSNIADIDFKALDGNKKLPLNPDLDKRRQIYKNVRKDIDLDEKQAK